MLKPRTNDNCSPPQLAEVCSILALGLLRARFARRNYPKKTDPGEGEISLHFQPDQSVHANSQPGRDP